MTDETKIITLAPERIKMMREEWEQFLSLLNNSIQEISKRDLLGPEAIVGALVSVGCEIALSNCPDRTAVHKMLLENIQQTMKEWDDAEKTE